MDANMDAMTSAQSGAVTETHPDVGLELAAKAMLIGKAIRPCLVCVS
jgi:hypothetical protein